MNNSAKPNSDRRKFLARVSTLGAASLLAPYLRSEAAGAQPLLGRRLTAVAEQVVEVGGVVGMQVRPLI